jgi:hypothetical protein
MAIRLSLGSAIVLMGLWASASLAQTPGTSPKQFSEAFLAKLVADTEAAIRFLREESDIGRGGNFSVFAEHIRTTARANGAALRYEYSGETRPVESLVLQTYYVIHQEKPVRLIFTYYRAETRWSLSHIRLTSEWGQY